jgi:hypothetical protein
MIICSDHTYKILAVVRYSSLAGWSLPWTSWHIRLLYRKLPLTQHCQLPVILLVDYMPCKVLFSHRNARKVCWPWCSRRCCFFSKDHSIPSSEFPYWFTSAATVGDLVFCLILLHQNSRDVSDMATGIWAPLQCHCPQRSTFNSNF